jgi:hypothetical protein
VIELFRHGMNQRARASHTIRPRTYKVDTNRADVALRVRVILHERDHEEDHAWFSSAPIRLSYRKPKQQARLADSRVTDQKKLRGKAWSW